MRVTGYRRSLQSLTCRLRIPYEPQRIARRLATPNYPPIHLFGQSWYMIARGRRRVTLLSTRGQRLEMTHTLIDKQKLKPQPQEVNHEQEMDRQRD